MFNKLIVSTINGRRQRTARFFCGTAVFYLLAVAAAFAVSIIVENPKLADTGEHLELMILPPPSTAGSPKPVAVVNRGSSAPATYNDPTHVRNIEDVISSVPGPARPNAPPVPPGIGNVEATGTGGVGVGDGVPGASFGVPGGEEHGNQAPLPKPDPPAPVAQVKPVDNRPVRLTSNVLQGKAITRRTPDYPPLAKQIHLDGSVSVEVIISPDGRVESARAVSGHPLLKTAAVAAATGWRFQPTLLNGVAVQVTGVIVFNFTLN